MHWHYWLGFSLFLAPSMCLCVCRRHVVFFFCGGCIVSLTLTGLRSNGFENFDECHQRLPSTQWWTEKGWTLNFRWTVPFQYVAIGAHIAIRFPPAKRKKKNPPAASSVFSGNSATFMLKNQEEVQEAEETLIVSVWALEGRRNTNKKRRENKRNSFWKATSNRRKSNHRKTRDTGKRQYFFHEKCSERNAVSCNLS